MLTVTIVNSNDANRIANFLARNSSCFIPPLCERINLFDYANKLSQKAVNIFLIYEKNDVGHAGFYVNKPPSAFLSTFCIDYAFKGMSLGKKLLLEVIVSCKKHHCKTIYLEVSLKNQIAQKFYLSKNFIIVKTNDETIIMTREIATDPINRTFCIDDRQPQTNSPP